jgi:hypothetical protein
MTAKWAVRVPLILLVIAVSATGVVFLVAGGLTGNWHRAWDVLSGSTAPFRGSYPAVFFTLSIFGYLLIPVVIGIYAVDAVSRFISRRVKSLADATDNIRVKLDTFKAMADNLKKDK